MSDYYSSYSNQRLLDTFYSARWHRRYYRQSTRTGSAFPDRGGWPRVTRHLGRELRRRGYVWRAGSWRLA